MAAEQFAINGIEIPAPDTYDVVFSDTSTEDSGRTQDLVMHNTPLGTISGYDLSWNALTWADAAKILNAIIGKSEYSFHHASPLVPEQWIDRTFYSAEYNLSGQNLNGSANLKKWKGLKVSLRSIEPV